MPDSFEIGPKFYCHGRTLVYIKIRSSLFYFRSRLRCSDTEFAEPSFVLMFAWTLINNSLFRHIEH